MESEAAKGMADAQNGGIDMARKSRKNIALPQTTQAAVVDMPPKVTLATAAYARLSVENSGNETDDTIQTQITLVHNFIVRHPDLELVDTYVDNGYTGTNFDRPEFERLMQDVKSGKIQCIVVKDLSRFGRNYLETGHYLETIFPRLNVRFIAVTDDFDSTRPEDMESITVPIKNMVNGLYAKDISNKLRAVNEGKRKRGERCGSFPPYGLVLTEDKKNYLPDGETLPYVRAIYTWNLMGVNKHEIVRRLELLQAPSPRQRQRTISNNAEPENTGDYVWRSNAVTRILKNQIYTGDTVTGQTQLKSKNGYDRKIASRENWTVTPNTHEGIILRSDYEAAQELSAAGQRVWQAAMDRSAERREKNPVFFSGLVYCAGCGTAMCIDRKGGENGTNYNLYFCNSDSRRHACYNTKVQENLLKILVMDQICTLIKAMCSRKKMIQEMMQGDSDKNVLLSLKRKEAYLSEKITQAENRKMALYEDLVTGLFDQIEYQSLKEHYIREIQQLDKKLQETVQLERLMGRRIQQYMELIENLEKYLDDRTFNIGLVNELVERIDVSKDGSIAIRFKCNDVYEELIQMIEGIQNEE